MKLMRLIGPIVLLLAMLAAEAAHPAELRDGFRVRVADQRVLILRFAADLDGTISLEGGSVSNAEGYRLEQDDHFDVATGRFLFRHEGLQGAHSEDGLILTITGSEETRLTVTWADAISSYTLGEILAKGMIMEQNPKGHLYLTCLSPEFIKEMDQKLAEVDGVLKRYEAGNELPPGVPISSIASVRSHYDKLNEMKNEVGRNDLARQFLDTLVEETRSLESGTDPFKGKTGDVTRAYYKETGQAQPYRMYIPQSYTGGTPYPLVVGLHPALGSEDSFIVTVGGNPPEKAVYGGLKGVCETHNMIVVCPRGEGKENFEGPGEKEFLRVIDEVESFYNIDRERVYLTGYSQGGHGTWYLGPRYPDRFAAICPSGGYGTLALADNLLHVPTLIAHAQLDDIVPIADAKRIYTTLKEMGYPADYLELPGISHAEGAYVQMMDDIFTWFEQFRLVRQPRKVVFGTYSLRHSKAYWVRIDDLAEWGDVGKLTAEVKENNRIEVNSTNLTAFALFPEEKLLDPNQDVDVTVDGQAAFKGKLGPGQELAFQRTSSPEPHGWSCDQCSQQPLAEGARTKLAAHAPQALTRDGAESLFGNWKTDVFRRATGADVAMVNNGGLRTDLGPGDVSVDDILLANYDDGIWTFSVMGRELLEMLDFNVKLRQSTRMQVSGIEMKVFIDEANPKTNKILSSNIDPERSYSIATEDFICQHGMEYFGKEVKAQDTGLRSVKAQIKEAMRQKELVAAREGRIVLAAE